MSVVQMTAIEELKELESSREKIQKIVAEAQGSLDKAKAELKKTGKYADPSWFAITKTTIRDRTTELHSINRQIKQLRCQLSRSNPKASFFQEAARKLLDKATYDEINKLANSWMVGKTEDRS